jgi:ABC-2 type transport system permease protein
VGNLSVIFKRELASYFATPLAYIFIVIFLITNGIFTFELGGFFLRGQADLLPFSVSILGSISLWCRQLR